MLKTIFSLSNERKIETKFINHPLDKRIEESKRIMLKYPDRRPIICNKGNNAETPILSRNKFLVPLDLTLGQFMYVVRKHLKLEPEQGLYFFINSTIPTNSCLISNLYDEHKSEDGFLYITYSLENTFG
jgi:GABA(A) receptor-associated protein